MKSEDDYFVKKKYCTLLLLKGNSHTWVQTDVGQSQSVNSLVETIISKYKQPPTIAVNCAGIIRDKLLAKMDEQNFDDVIRINLKVRFILNNIGKSMILTYYDIQFAT